MTDMTAEQALDQIERMYIHGESLMALTGIIRQTLSQRVPDGWVSTSQKLPQHSLPVIGMNPDWIDEDFNVHGIRECFVTGDGTEWVCAYWHDEQDCYATVHDRAPTHWMHYPTVGMAEQSAQSADSDEFLDIPPSLRRQSNMEQHGQQVIDELRAEVEALKEDAERLDWLDKNVTMVSDSERYLPRRVYWGKGTNKNARQAIDVARGQK